jgi:hypothetical protein
MGFGAAGRAVAVLLCNEEQPLAAKASSSAKKRTEIFIFDSNKLMSEIL